MTETLDRRADALIRNSYYEATVSRPLTDDPMLEDSLDADVCVIGTGFSGLSVALECRARQLSVVVLSMRIAPAGAPRDATADSCSPVLQRTRSSKSNSASKARAAWALSADAVKLVHERIGRCGIECDFTPGCMTGATKAKRSACRCRVESQPRSPQTTPGF